MSALILGIIVGVVLALTGAGGGILAVPLLIFGARLGVAEAGPIGLLAVGMAATLGALLGLRAGTVRYRAALLVACAGMLFSPAGIWLAQRTDNRWLGVLFALIMLYVAVRTYRQVRQAGKHASHTEALHAPPPCVRYRESGRFIWTLPCARALALSGTLAGLLSGLLGVGGGFVMVPALRRYTDLGMESIIPTSLAVIALVSAMGVASSAIAGQLNWGIALPFSLGSLGGMIAGRFIAGRLAGPQMQKGFAMVSALVAVGMIVKAFA
ncbi:MAG TPA: sulfite exporter TauE/SafE family protein [Noviherbaspirillum sp.]|uniref:sulfite exporter TauE/SafE family protein n=1 Tax=Noviherbaspirillum sp. TaxID=1926288 RepID=UPI002B46F2A1|nr:sulfite exporter TauE/SafE family protein [Noviherbaspirillum sp.]HJV88528.1 sulfite exporter TauE/SafE family protein [Noviherbaspirillum sp.]